MLYEVFNSLKEAHGEESIKEWIPACVGMTGGRRYSQIRIFNHELHDSR